MKIKSFITAYNRHGMLSKVVNHLNTFGIIPHIKDDGSTYNHNIPQYFRHEHRGIDKFWITWNEMLEDCKDSDSELFLFMPDDFQDLEIHPSDEPKIITKVLSYVGINIREADIVKLMDSKNIIDLQKEKI